MEHESQLAQFYRRHRHKKLALVLALLVTLVSVLTDIIIGSQGLSLTQVLTAIFTPSYADIASQIIIWDIRMPMALIAPLIGGALALAGAQMQTTLNNPLADPYTFGLSAAAGLGAALSITNLVVIPFVDAQYQVMLMAFLFCLMSTFIIANIARLKRISIEAVMLFGIAMMFGYDALLTMMHYIASETQLQTLIFWQMGSLDRASWEKITTLVIVVSMILAIMMRDSWKLSALKIGAERAEALGVNVGRLRNKTLLLVSVLTALSVSFVGAIGFVGLVAPHIARMVVGEDQRFFLPASFLVGAALLSLASIVSKSLLVGVILPLTVVMAMVGIPFFIYLIFRKGGHF